MLLKQSHLITVCTALIYKTCFDRANQPLQTGYVEKCCLWLGVLMNCNTQLVMVLSQTYFDRVSLTFKQS